MADYKELESLKDFNMFDGTFESIKDNLFMRLFNKNNLPLNKQLDTVPHINFIDLVITFSIEEKTYFDKTKGLYTYLITNEDIEMLNIDIKDLKAIAMENLLNKNSPRVETISQHIIRNHIFSPLTRIPSNMEAMAQINEKEHKKSFKIFEGEQFGSIPLINSSEDTKDVLLISNRTQTFASVNLTNPDVLKKVFIEFGNENFFIVPTSVHEIICIKYSFATNNGSKSEKQAIEDLEDMIEEINDIIHENTNDILSYNVYYHICDDNCTMIIN